VSAWEIAIKCARGSLELPEAADTYVVSRMTRLGCLSLPVQISHALRVASLPRHHADPFDRLLVAQAQLEDLPLVTSDPAITRYDVKTLW
jgi:PIN domain nuclease of toxin-antitoxin system